MLVSVSAQKPPTTTPSGLLGMQPAPADVVNAIAQVSPSTFAKAGSMITSSGPCTGSITPLERQPRLTHDGESLITYVGSNFCPYCAATRWPLTVALARFGRFRGFRTTTSGAAEPFPGTSTLSFYGSASIHEPVGRLPAHRTMHRPAFVQQCERGRGMRWLQAAAVLVGRSWQGLPQVRPPALRLIRLRGHLPLLGLWQRSHRERSPHGSVGPRWPAQMKIAQSLGNPDAEPAKTILVTPTTTRPRSAS